MSAHEWKPGDVAMVTIFGEEHVALRQYDGWANPNGQTSSEPKLGEVTGARPLVVIDPEDREQVERLARALRDVGKDSGPTSSLDGRWDETHWERVRAENTRAALRSLITPPGCGSSITIGDITLECERDSGHVTDHRNDSVAQGVRWGVRS